MIEACIASWFYCYMEDDLLPNKKLFLFESLLVLCELHHRERIWQGMSVHSSSVRSILNIVLGLSLFRMFLAGKSLQLIRLPLSSLS